MHEAEKIIAQLGLESLPHEGGFFRQTWIAPRQAGETRAAASAIHYLITRDSFSALHRLAMHETWHFYAGDPVRLVQLHPTGEITRVTLGGDVLTGQQPQCTVPAGTWQGARLVDGAERGWALLGCTVTPAWDEGDFELGEREELWREFPGAADEIARLTRLRGSRDDF